MAPTPRAAGVAWVDERRTADELHENVSSQCDNLVLMRLNSAADSAFIAELLGFAPPSLSGFTTDFGRGEALVAGTIASHPAVMRVGSRVAREGAATWTPTGRGPGEARRIRPASGSRMSCSWGLATVGDG
jgi:hypothetical protein